MNVGRGAAADLPTRQTAFERAGYACERCGASAPVEHPLWCGLDINHRLRLADGGTNHPDNLIALCVDCHQEWTGVEMAGRMLFAQWMEQPRPTRRGQKARHAPRGRKGRGANLHPHHVSVYENDEGLALLRALVRERGATGQAALLRELVREEAKRKKVRP